MIMYSAGDRMNSIQFYTKYEDLATQINHLNSTRKEMPKNEARIKDLELHQQVTELFADYMGQKINLLA